MKNFFIIILLIVIFVIGISIGSMVDLKPTLKKETESIVLDDTIPDTKQTKSNMIKIDLKIESLFDMYVFKDDYEIIDGKKIWQNTEFMLKPENAKLYDEIRDNDDEQKSVVIFPMFTAAAYTEPGFYTHFRGECDKKCLTVYLKEHYPPTFPVSGNGYHVLQALGYEIISDIEVDQNPKILEKYDKVILLHNEYVTKKEFDAITSHPNVIYLYPNALYAEIRADYENNSITLLRGHNFPNNEIRNGFDWKFDNSELEYDTNCLDMEFDKIDNGWMLNCYPETVIHQNEILLKIIRNF